MVRRLIAVPLAVALTLLSPGLDASRAFAAVVAPRVALPAAGLNGAASARVLPTLNPLSVTRLSAPSLGATLTPALANTALTAAAAADSARPAATVPQMAVQLAPALEAAADGRSGASADRGNAQHIADVITGQRSISGEGDASVIGSFGPSASALSAPADAPKAAGSAPEAPKAPAVKVVNSRIAYAWHRFMLSAIASMTGAVHSMPAAGRDITRAAIKAAADKSVVISDFDDTLAKYNEVLSPEMIDAVRAVRAAGKDFVVISDRGDEKRAHQLTVFESLEPLGELREGMYIAANSGGRVYQFNNGAWEKKYETPALEAEKKALVVEASEATKQRMAAIGAVQHDPVATGNPNPAESWNTYGYAMMLKVGSSEAQVRGAAAIMQEELAKRGIEAEVNPRFAKDPANPPYINFSIVTKQPATAYIAKALGATAEDVVLVGDSQYVPREAKKQGSFLDKLGAKLAGRAMPKTGNATDRNMEKALPGALVFAVGHNADPRMSNAWVTDVKGPDSTRAMLYSVASKKKGDPKSKDGLKAAGSVLLLAALVALAAAGFYAIASALAEIITQGEQLLREGWQHDPFQFAAGAALVAGSLKAGKDGKKDGEKLNEDKPLSRGEKWLTAILLPVAVVGALYLWYLLYSGMGHLTPSPQDIPEGWHGPIPSIDDIFRGAGFAGFGVMGILGAKMAWTDVKAFLRKAGPALLVLGGLALVAGMGVLFYVAAGAAPAAVPAIPTAPAGWEGLFRTMGFAAGGIGLAGMMGMPRVLDNPASYYPKALETATKYAAQRGVPAEQVLFVQSTAVMPLFQGKQWNYEFALPRQDGNYDLVYVDTERNITAIGLDSRVSVYEKVKTLQDGAVAKNLSAYLFSQRGVQTGPEQALDALRREQPGFGGSVSVSLRLEQTEDLDPWYRFYDNNGAEAAVNARTAEIRVAKAPAAPSEKKGLSPVAKFLIVAGLAAAAAYAIATGHAAALGYVALAGAIKKTADRAKKERGAKLTDEDIRSTASYVISYKGRPWSSTEFNSVYYPALESLKAKGATKAQIELFEKLVNDAPVRGGGFNPWSGD